MDTYCLFFNEVKIGIFNCLNMPGYIYIGSFLLISILCVSKRIKSNVLLFLHSIVLNILLLDSIIIEEIFFCPLSVVDYFV